MGCAFFSPPSVDGDELLFRSHAREGFIMPAGILEFPVLRKGCGPGRRAGRSLDFVCFLEDSFSV